MSLLYFDSFVSRIFLSCLIQSGLLSTNITQCQKTFVIGLSLLFEKNTVM